MEINNNFFSILFMSFYFVNCSIILAENYVSLFDDYLFFRDNNGKQKILEFIYCVGNVAK